VSDGGYAPRNVLNAEALKDDILRRSRARGDNDDIRLWLLNHFYRHLIGNFEPAQAIGTLHQARDALGGAAPAWVPARLREAVPLVWIDPSQAGILSLENRLLEFLRARTGTRLEGKLQRITCPQALALWEREHADIATRIAKGWRQSQPDAIAPLLDTTNGRFIEFRADSALLRAEMAFESYVMRHCLGQFADRHALTGGYGEQYAEAIERGKLRLFSFRDAGGQPHITLSAVVREHGRVQIDQIKGKQNRPPIARYVEDVLACLNALNTTTTTPADAIQIGVVHDGAGWARIEAVADAQAQARLVAHHPQLYPRLAQPGAMAQWLVLARQPELLNDEPLHSAALRFILRRKDGVPEPGWDDAMNGEPCA
jgi:hypothetical protein